MEGKRFFVYTLMCLYCVLHVTATDKLNGDVDETPELEKGNESVMDAKSIGSKPSATKDTISTNCTAIGMNDTDVSCSQTSYSFTDMYENNKGMMMRTVYVIVGITTIVIVYFGIKSFRQTRKRSKAKKYGVISKHDLEMAPLDEDDDEDEDMTVFEVNGKPK